MPATIAAITTTTTNSTSVKPDPQFKRGQGYGLFQADFLPTEVIIHPLP